MPSASALAVTLGAQLIRRLLQPIWISAKPCRVEPMTDAVDVAGRVGGGAEDHAQGGGGADQLVEDPGGLVGSGQVGGDDRRVDAPVTWNAEVFVAKDVGGDEGGVDRGDRQLHEALLLLRPEGHEMRTLPGTGNVSMWGRVRFAGQGVESGMWGGFLEMAGRFDAELELRAPCAHQRTALAGWKSLPRQTAIGLVSDPNCVAADNPAAGWRAGKGELMARRRQT